MVIGDSATAKRKRSKRMAVELLNQNQGAGLDWTKREKERGFDLCGAQIRCLHQVDPPSGLRFAICESCNKQTRSVGKGKEIKIGDDAGGGWREMDCPRLQARASTSSVQ